MFYDIGSLDTIIKETVSAIESSKRQIFDIAENVRLEYSRLQNELTEVRRLVSSTVVEVDAVTAEERKARARLAEVSKNFKKYTEDDIKKAYEDAQAKQLQLTELRGRESLLRYKRDNLEDRKSVV